MFQHLHDLVRSSPPISGDLTCNKVWRLFADSPDLLTLAVIDERGAPVGIVNRHEFLVDMSHMYGHALYGKRPVSRLMDADPLIVDVGVDLNDLASTIVQDKPSALLKGFIVAERGAYLGVGTALSLLQLLVRATEMRAGELEVSRAQAEQASQFKSDFLAKMSHELRTPLNAIIGFAEVIHTGTFGKVSARYQEYAHDILQSGQHLLAIINDLLDLTKIESGQVELHEAPVDLAETIQAAIVMMRARASGEDLRLHAELPERLPQVRADERLIRQMLLNLLANAIKFTPPGGDIAVGVIEQADGSIRVFVADNGIGIEIENIPRVLEPFVQVENGLARKYEGTGLGLPLVKSFAELHGGALTIDSGTGLGTTVNIILPRWRVLAETPAAAARTAFETGPKAGSSQGIRL